MSRGASEAEIKKAYRRLAHDHHPYVNAHDSGAEERFKELTEAYEVLSNPESRRAYDTYGHHERPYGVVSLIGHKRMDYDAAITTVRSAAETLTHRLSAGF